MVKINSLFFKINYIWCRRLSTKQSYYHRTSDIAFRPWTLGQLAEFAAQHYGDRWAVISRHQNKRINFHDALEEADRLAAGLGALGVRKGDRVGLWAPNLIEWYVSYVACARGGYVAVLMNPYYGSHEAERMIKKADMRTLICGDVFKKQNYYDLLRDICPELEKCNPEDISSSKIPCLKNVVMITEDNKKGTFKYSDILNLADENSIKSIKQSQDSIDMDDPCNIQFTSGTTGDPKAPVQSHFAVVNNGYFIGIGMELQKDYHKICLPNPFFHVYGTVVAISSAINHGNTIVLPSDVYDPEENLTAIAEEKCSVIFGTPTMHMDLINEQLKRNEDVNLDIAVSGGALCSPKLFSDMQSVLKAKKVKSVYGMTEMTAGLFISTEKDTTQQSLNTVGKLMEHMEAKVVNEKGEVVPFGEPGELYSRGFSTMLGYYKDEEKTREIIDSNGWVHTGDQFVLTPDGYGKIVGRIKDMIIRGGENIYPKEIEEYLATHPDILAVYVIGVPHERLGEEVCACIKTRNGLRLSVEEIRNYCKGKLSNFTIPTVVEMMESFPTTTSGKIQKHKLVDVNLCQALQQRELNYCIQITDMACIIALDIYRNYSIYDLLKKIVPEIDESKDGRIISNNLPFLKYIIIISDVSYKGTLKYKTVKSTGNAISKEVLKTIRNKIHHQDLVTILFTSGTTGNPKIVGLTHYQLYNNCNITHHRLGNQGKQHTLCFYLPLFHLFGILITMLVVRCSGTIVLPSYYYNPEANLLAISEEKCSFVPGPPVMFSDLIRVQKIKNLPLCIDLALTGSAPCSDQTTNGVLEVLNVRNFVAGYGSSEALVVMLGWIRRGDEGNCDLLGDVLDHVELKISDGNDKIVPLGTVGNLSIKGYSVISNYLYTESSIKEVDEEGWYKSGDAFCMDENKQFRIAGRLKELINRGGEKIGPSEVEKILETHPDIEEVAVIGTYHERLGEEVCACIRTKLDSLITLEDIKTFCKGKLAYYKIPSRMQIVESFPKTPLGKVQRGKLLEIFNQKYLNE
ncbi:unnamed protein product [Phyllotreta striolata]|uniref:Medium-chain acyl-CoA ligase ACSF2, mitochondrial n=1 Tax=Phyllotreta striolata TaxID=444603 RepID=A0A9N9TZE9_PHYSR|nr:unnamed protein product [Phyllotreta striolata]